MALKSLTGFRDFFPAEHRSREWVFSTWKETARRYGFESYDGPPLESLELFTQKSGEEIKAQLYHFEDKGGRQVSLRPEMTPTLARMIGARHREFKKPLKWYSIPQVFRYEKPQKGRLREHYQWNCDIMGEAGLGAEAELIALLVDALRAFGLSEDDFEVRLSDRQLWHEFFHQHRVPEIDHERFFQVIDKFERTPPEVSREKLGSLAGAVEEMICQRTPNARLKELRSRLNDLGVGASCSIDPVIIRGLAYYTGVVFEVHDRKRAFRAIAGGGRYDGLIGALSGIDLPAVGFGVGDVVLTDLLREKRLLQPEPDPKALYLCIIGEEARSSALQEAARFRKAGYRVDYPLSETKLGKQLEAAESRGFARALLLDSQWMQTGQCGCKDLICRKQIQVLLAWENGHPQIKPI